MGDSLETEKQRAERLIQALTKTQARIALKEERAKKLQAENERKRQTKEKIELGGIVVAAGANNLDPAELCGILVAALANYTDERQQNFKQIGLKHLAERKRQRGG